MRIAFAINKNHTNYGTYLAFLNQITIEQNLLDIDIISYTDITNIYSIVNKKCRYVLILDRYCYIDLEKLYTWLKNNKPDIAALSCHEPIGIGYPFLFLIRTPLLQPFKKLQNICIKNNVQNYFMNLILRHTKEKTVNKESLAKNKILTLDKFCYLGNCNYTTGAFHKSIFTNISDLEKNFSETLSILASKDKEVHYNNKTYKLKIGKSFFIYKYWNFAILPDHTILVWNTIKKDWIRANKKQQQILEQIL